MSTWRTQYVIVARMFTGVVSKIAMPHVLKYVNMLYTLTLHQFNFGAISVTFQAISVLFRSHFGDKICTAFTHHLHATSTPPPRDLHATVAPPGPPKICTFITKNPAFETHFVIFDNLLALVETVVSCRRNIISCKIGPCFHTRFFVDAPGMIISWLFVHETPRTPQLTPNSHPAHTQLTPDYTPPQTLPKPHFLEEFPNRPRGHIFPGPRSPQSQHSIDMLAN